MKIKRSCFTAEECINGYCPRALLDSNDERISDMASNIYSCESCRYRTYECKDCIFENTECCPERR